MRLMRKIVKLIRFVRPLFPQWLVNYCYHLPQAVIASYLYGNPGSDLEIIGVTGTDGKTTTSNLIYHILKTAHKKVALISTVGAKIGNKTVNTGFHVTSPNPFALQRFFRQMRSRKIRYVVLEVTSHGIDQFRFYPLRTAVSVLTNITHEHLDYHKTFSHYRDTKLKLLKTADHAVVNKDLAIFPEINAHLAKVLFSTYSIHNPSQLQAENVVYSPNLITFTLGKTAYSLPMSGEYNLNNALAAISTALLLGISPSDIKRGLNSFKGVPGRLESIPNQKNIHAYVDFAHTPNALQEVLTNLRSQKKPSAKLIVIFGAAGLRDASKRPLMGAVAAKLADKIVITSEDPRFENPADIAKDIMAGIPAEEKHKVTIELDREKAINLAIKNLAKSGDWVVSCGKGHEESMNLDGISEISWSDRQTMLSALNTK